MTFNDYLFLANSDELISQRFERKLRDACTKSTEENITGIRHLHDGVILIKRPQCFVKMLSYSKSKETIRKISLTTEATVK